MREKLALMGWWLVDDTMPSSDEAPKSIPISFNPATSQGISYYQNVHRQSPILPVNTQKGRNSKAA